MTDLKNAALRAITLMDLTSLNDSDTNESIIELCKAAKTDYANTAAICVYPRFVPIVKKQLQLQGTPDIQVATVTNFPHGSDDLNIAVTETKAAIVYGADEVDVTFPYKALIAGNEQIGFDIVEQCKAECKKHNKLLKVIIESGELDHLQIKRASEISIAAGADMIKTSTGKVPVNATPEAASIMLMTIKAMNAEDKVGFKASGGVKNANDAAQYLALADDIFGSNWSNTRFYRFGASSLLPNLLNTLGSKVSEVKAGY